MHDGGVGYASSPLKTVLGGSDGSVAYTDVDGLDKTLIPILICWGETSRPSSGAKAVPHGPLQCMTTVLVTARAAAFDGKAKPDEFTPKISAQYSFDSGMAYATYSEGFRSGGFNGRATAPNNTGPYEPEGVKSWEAGAKLTLFDNRFREYGGVPFGYDNKQETIVKPGQDGQATLWL